MWGCASTLSRKVEEQLSNGVQHIYSSHTAFAAMRHDGSVAAWGDGASGGDVDMVQEQLVSDIEQVYSTKAAFAALKGDGSVVTWGAAYAGGNSDAVRDQLACKLAG
eukprot:gnl/TRDRNA2_/TRDRNA2_122106_c0_seq1.p1 gnl/TRDRNA2_/TRDRNA2_122106_c0~~gnl/TRDRNA2_/TRDRNA2_122106_c0_seq1.p1  ORF type:complete len:120 (-),score=34.12 gnl/TRDRNA2_/TRDRNA2_122106_c0_seq1:474-794(-)